MDIILYSSNPHKITEIKAILPARAVFLYSDFVEKFDISEVGESFKANAFLKLKALREKLFEKMGEKLDNYALIAEDSGLCVEAFGGAPSIFSARFANVASFENGRVKIDKNARNAQDSKDKNNLNTAIALLKKLGLSQSRAEFVSCVAIYARGKYHCVHGFLRGKIVDSPRGKGGFGYDPIFVPDKICVEENSESRAPKSESNFVLKFESSARNDFNAPNLDSIRDNRAPYALNLAPNAQNLTLAELSKEQKNAISHRFRALTLAHYFL